MRRRRRPSCSPPLHRTEPVFDRETGKLIGHVCHCRRNVLTANGNPSSDLVSRGWLGVVARNKSKDARIAAVRLNRRLRRRAGTR